MIDMRIWSRYCEDASKHAYDVYRGDGELSALEVQLARARVYQMWETGSAGEVFDYLTRGVVGTNFVRENWLPSGHYPEAL